MMIGLHLLVLAVRKSVYSTLLVVCPQGWSSTEAFRYLWIIIIRAIRELIIPRYAVDAVLHIGPSLYKGYIIQ